MNNENQTMPAGSPDQTSMKSGSSGKMLKIILVVAIIGALIYLVKYTGVVSSLMSQTVNKDAYSAVFLQNGQVYFGKITKNTKDEMILKNVYYLQVDGSGADAAAAAQARFNLVQLGNELHGPTDELFINKSQITFFEYLRPDSKVVETINSQQAK